MNGFRLNLAIMKKILTIFITAFIFAAPSFAAGIALDVSATSSIIELPELLPILPEVPTPQGLEAADGALEIDPLFPNQLAERGNLQGAILEWERIAYRSDDKTIVAHAMLQIAKLYRQLDQPENELAAYRSFMKKFPQHQKTDEVLYRMSVAAHKAWPQLENSFVKQLQRDFAESLWTEAAVYRDLWYRARAGEALDNLDSANFADATELLNRLRNNEENDGFYSNRVTLALALSVLPGGGHLFLQDWEGALTYFIIFMFLLVAFVYSFTQKHWPYALIWAGAIGVLYATTMHEANDIATQQVKAHRVEMMNGWVGLYPRPPYNN